MAETGRLEKRTNRSRESSLKLMNTTQAPVPEKPIKLSPD